MTKRHPMRIDTAIKVQGITVYGTWKHISISYNKDHISVTNKSMFKILRYNTRLFWSL